MLYMCYAYVFIKAQSLTHLCILGLLSFVNGCFIIKDWIVYNKGFVMG